MSGNPLLALKTLGQHVWLDNFSRSLLREGGLERLMREDGVDGVTSNPAIFHKAMISSPYYREDIEGLRHSAMSAEERYEALVIPDIQAACDLLLPSHVASAGETGYVSLEVSPALAHDIAGTQLAALRLRLAVGRDNLLIKVPGTLAGVQAFENLVAAGVRVNVTLIFSLVQYESVLQAYLRGAQKWLENGMDGRLVRSVASVFLSRVDTRVDHSLAMQGTASAAALMGKSGVALAKRCYERYREIFHGPDFVELAKSGVRPQTLLWASTGSKNPAWSDVFYVESLIGPETITTLPDATLAAFRVHGQAAANTLLTGNKEALAHTEALGGAGIDLNSVGEILQVEGVRLFTEAYQHTLAELRDPVD